MAAKILEGITGRWKSCVFLLSALMEQGAQVAATQRELVAPHLQEGDAEPSFFNSIIGRARRLSASMNALVKSDHALYGIQAQWTRLREQHTRHVNLLGEAIVAVRRAVLSAYKKPDLVSLALGSPRERRSEPLFRQAHLIDVTFQGPDLVEFLGEPRYEEAPDLKAPLDHLRKAIRTLRATLDALNKIRRQYDAELTKKDALIKEHDPLFTYTARSFEADCVLVGEKDLAKKVRPSETRSGSVTRGGPETAWKAYAARCSRPDPRSTPGRCRSTRCNCSPARRVRPTCGRCGASPTPRGPS